MTENRVRANLRGEFSKGMGKKWGKRRGGIRDGKIGTRETELFLTELLKIGEKSLASWAMTQPFFYGGKKQKEVYKLKRGRRERDESLAIRFGVSERKKKIFVLAGRRSRNFRFKKRGGEERQGRGRRGGGRKVVMLDRITLGRTKPSREQPQRGVTYYSNKRETAKRVYIASGENERPIELSQGRRWNWAEGCPG